MDIREERTTQAVLPDLSGPISSAVMAVFATLLLILAGFGPVLGDSSSPIPPTTALQPVPAPAPESRNGERPVEGVAFASPVLTASPPQIEDVSFPQGPVTASRDLQLEIHASDPDGDAVQLRTWWNINGREIETAAPVLPKAHLRRGDTITVRVVASDGGRESAPFLTPAGVVENSPPVITTFPTGFDAVGAFVYPIAAIDPDGDQGLEYRLAEGPVGMAIEPYAGTLTWLPGSGQNGRHRVRVEVRDGHGGVQYQAFDLTVRHPLLTAADLADRTAEP